MADRKVKLTGKKAKWLNDNYYPWYYIDNGVKKPRPMTDTVILRNSENKPKRKKFKK